MIDDARFEPITTADADGVLTTHQLPYHVAYLPSRFEPIGLAPAKCQHGVRRHPNPDVADDPLLKFRGPSWVRSRYLNGKGECPVCLGQPRPDDLTLGFVDPPEAAVV